MSESNDQVRLDVGGWISGPALPASEMEVLDQLARIWRDRYKIGFDGDTWSAQRMGNATVIITAESVEELRGFIWADFMEWSREAEKRS
jgi:hypothetical protein